MYYKRQRKSSAMHTRNCYSVFLQKKNRRKKMVFAPATKLLQGACFLREKISMQEKNLP